MSRAYRLWCALVHCFLCSSTMKMVVRVGDRCAWMLPLVRNGHVSGNLVVCICRLRATCIELPSHTPLQFLPLWSLCPRGAIGILCCVPKWMEFWMSSNLCSSRALRGCVVDLSRALCPECAAQIVETTSVHWRTIVLSDAECFVSVGPRSLSLDEILLHDTDDARALYWPLPIAKALC